jgi:DNA polymerase
MTYKIAIVGEAWGAEEAKARAPFVGASGQELTRMLSEAGIHRADCFLTNVFNVKPEPTNDIENLCTDKARGIVNRGPLKAGKYCKSELAGELGRLDRELREVKPNIILALGNTATWALIGPNQSISKVRGTVTGSLYGYGKVIPAFHPAAILRDWSLRAVTVLDFAKARRESEFPEIRRPERVVYIEPDLADMEWFYATKIVPCKSLSFDIETSGDQITCIGFAPGPSCALVVPFVDPRRPGHSYWPDIESEGRAWNYVRRVLATPHPKIAQNGLYDIHFLWRQYGIPVNNAGNDSMLAHHALQPESQKGLGFLGSVYSNEQSWKLLGKRGLTETIKRDA